ncbi:MAG: ribonuclease III [Clostridiales Family XIII bacterium]|nr:ribonuclease III [Clostridiales Family XIII bacterium]
MEKSNWDEQLTAFEERLGYAFCDRELLKRALRHSSYVNEIGGAGLESNERLEFLGDAVLECTVTALLFERGSGYSEGVLTAVRARLVRTDSLARMARRLGLGGLLLLGRGAERGGERDNDTVLEDAFEALIGAVFLDGTAALAQRVVRRLFTDEVDGQIRHIAHGERYFDYKTTLQIELQRGGAADIRYETVSESGPDHDKTFVVRVLHNGRPLGEGTGKTKKAAEQAAAEQALGGL